MAGRFLFQKFTSRMSRSTSLLGAQAPASVGAGAPVTTIASEVGIRTFSNRFHGAAVHPGSAVPSNRGIHGFAARKFDLLPCSGAAAAKTSSLTTSIPSNISSFMRPASVDSVTGARTFSSNASTTGHEISKGDDITAWLAQWEAKSKAWQATREANEKDWETTIAALRAKESCQRQKTREVSGLGVGVHWAQFDPWDPFGRSKPKQLTP
ncbi:hypothetical protein ACP70R_016159 [Stipagrostis hirtigluma subsp. patula]